MFKPIDITNEQKAELNKELSFSFGFSENKSELLASKKIAAYLKNNNLLIEGKSFSKFAEILKNNFSQSNINKKLGRICTQEFLEYAHLVLDLQNKPLTKENFFKKANYRISDAPIVTSLIHGNLDYAKDYLNFINEPITKQDIFTAHYSLTKNNIVTSLAYTAITLKKMPEIDLLLKKMGQPLNHTDLETKITISGADEYKGHSLAFAMLSQAPESFHQICYNNNISMRYKDFTRDFSNNQNIRHPFDKSVMGRVFESPAVNGTHADMKELWDNALPNYKSINNKKLFLKAIQRYTLNSKKEKNIILMQKRSRTDR